MSRGKVRQKQADRSKKKTPKGKSPPRITRKPAPPKPVNIDPSNLADYDDNSGAGED